MVEICYVVRCVDNVQAGQYRQDQRHDDGQHVEDDVKEEDGGGGGDLISSCKTNNTSQYVECSSPVSLSIRCFVTVEIMLFNYIQTGGFQTIKK